MHDQAGPDAKLGQMSSLEEFDLRNFYVSRLTEGTLKGILLGKDGPLG